MIKHMNSFQKWADDYARAHGFTVGLTGNWVTLYKDGESEELMTVSGVQLHCKKSLKNEAAKA